MATGLKDKKLQEMKASKQHVAIYLTSGVQISGEVMEFDEHDVLVSSPNGAGWCLVSRPAIATLKPHLKKKD